MRLMYEKQFCLHMTVLAVECFWSKNLHVVA